jgi:hypothetical protein
VFFPHFLTDFTLRGLPAGWPSLFFCAIRFFFWLGVSSLAVTGVLELTRFDGLQYGVPRLSPFLRPQGFPERTSTQSSLNHLFKAAPALVFLTAIYFFFRLPQFFAPTFLHLAMAPEA